MVRKDVMHGTTNTMITGTNYNKYEVSAVRIAETRSTVVEKKKEHHCERLYFVLSVVNGLSIPYYITLLLSTGNGLLPDLCVGYYQHYIGILWYS